MKQLSTVLQWGAVAVASIFIAGWVVRSLYPEGWRSTHATVHSSQITHVGSRTPEWVLSIRAAYEVEGKAHEATTVVFRNPDREVAQAEKRKWPPGRPLTVYVDAKHPERVSLAPDGGREATVVMIVILTPLLVFSAWLAMHLLWRRAV